GVAEAELPGRGVPEEIRPCRVANQYVSSPQVLAVPGQVFREHNKLRRCGLRKEHRITNVGAEEEAAVGEHGNRAPAITGQPHAGAARLEDALTALALPR